MNSKPSGYVLISKAKVVATKQCAWHDLTTFEAPFIGKVNPNNPYAMANAISRRRSSRGSIIGSSYGATSVSNVVINTADMTVRWDESCGIGD